MDILYQFASKKLVLSCYTKIMITKVYNLIHKYYCLAFLGLVALLLLLPVFKVWSSDDPGHETLEPPSLKNPIKADTLMGFIKAILDAVVTIGVPIVALMIIYSGFRFVMARGDPDALKKAKANFLWVIIGAAIILGAWLFAQVIAETIGALK